MSTGTPAARMIALGSAALVEGFALVGFEAYPDATPAVMEQLLGELLHQQRHALVVVEQDLARRGGRNLERAQGEGGHIVITEIPSLNLPVDYHSRVENLVQRVLGPAALHEEAGQ